MLNVRQRIALASATALTVTGLTAMTVAPTQATPSAKPDAGASADATAATPADTLGGDRADKDSRKLRKKVDVKGMKKHLEALSAIADKYGDRAAGRPGSDKTAEYIEGTLRKAGYKPTRQYFDFTYNEILANTVTVNGDQPRELEPGSFTYSPQTPDGGVTGDLAAPADPFGCTSDAWGGVDLTGKIALVSRGNNCPFSAKVLAAAGQGAEAVLIYNNAVGHMSGTLGAENPDFVPAGGLTQAEGQELLADMADGPVNVTFELRILSEKRKTYNIIADTPRGDRNNVVTLGAHYDSIQDGPGINDNGTGTAALLEVATELKSFKKLNNTVRFAFWGNEEDGLLGSTHYVNDLVQNDPEGLADIAMYLNFDMIGSPNYIIATYDADASSYEPTAPVPPGSIEIEQQLRDYFASVDQDVVDYQFSGRSDYQPFINNGIPSGGLSTGSNGLKSEAEAKLFGGTAGISYDPNYHSPADDLDNVALDALDIHSDAIADAVIRFGYDTSVLGTGRHVPVKAGKRAPALTDAPTR